MLGHLFNLIIFKIINNFKLRICNISIDILILKYILYTISNIIRIFSRIEMYDKLVFLNYKKKS